MITIDEIIDVVIKYQKANSLNTLDMCNLMGMKSGATYHGFIHKKQETKLAYMLEFINSTGITFEDIINGKYKTNENLNQNQIVEKYEIKIERITELLEQERTTVKFQQKHIKELYDKIEKLEPGTGSTNNKVKELEKDY
jgi:hypothetical protein